MHRKMKDASEALSRLRKVKETIALKQPWCNVDSCGYDIIPEIQSPLSPVCLVEGRVRYLNVLEAMVNIQDLQMTRD